MSMPILEKSKENLAILGNGNYMLLFLGGLISRLGSNIHYVGLSWYVLEQSGSGLALGMIMMVAALPGVVLAPFAGVWVDRLNRKGLIVWMDLIRGVLVLAMAQLLLMDLLTYPYLLIGTFCISICGTLFNPAVSASIPNIVQDRDLSKANSLENLSINLTGVLGMALGGILVGLYGVLGAFILNGISFILSGISEIFIQMPERERRAEGELANKEQTSFNSELWGGIRFIISNPLLFSICGASLVLNFSYIGALGVGLPYIVKEVLGLGEIQFGLMESFFSIGAVLGSLGVILLPEIKRLFRVTVVGIGLHGVIMLLVGVTVMPVIIQLLTVGRVYTLMAGLMLTMGLVNVIMNVPMSTFFQRVVPDELRGRFYSLLGTFSQGLIPIAYLVSGFLLGIWPAYVLILIGGIAMVLIAVQLARIEEFRQMD